MLGPWWGPMKPFCGYVNKDRVGTVFPGGGTHKHYMWSPNFFPPQVVGTLRSSIEMHSLPLLPFTPCLLPFLPVHCLHSLFAPFALCSLHKHYMWSSKFFPPQVVGTLKPSIEMHSLPSLPSLPVHYISTICDHQSFFHHRWWGP